MRFDQLKNPLARCSCRNTQTRKPMFFSPEWVHMGFVQALLCFSFYTHSCEISSAPVASVSLQADDAQGCKSVRTPTLVWPERKRASLLSQPTWNLTFTLSFLSVSNLVSCQAALRTVLEVILDFLLLINHQPLWTRALSLAGSVLGSPPQLSLKRFSLYYKMPQLYCTNSS